MTNLSHAWLRHDVIAEPLVNQWYAWSFLISPATAARYLTHSQLKVLQSFIDAPDVHIEALKNPELVGGPFLQFGKDRVDDVKQFLEHSQSQLNPLITLSRAIETLDSLLANHPAGTALAELYPNIPEPLKGYVELVYDSNNHPSVRYLEPLLYRSGFYQPQHQAIALRLLPDCDKRAFVLSTPRLEGDAELILKQPFNNPLLDELFQSRFQPTDAVALADKLSIEANQREAFLNLFTNQAPPNPTPYGGEGLRVRYMGHACVLLETAQTSILVDPLIAYHHPDGMQRYSYHDLPNHIDYVVITHNHQDHVMFETLLQIRHKVGCILIPGGHRGSLIDPSLRQCLQQIGFHNVRELDHLECIDIPDGTITCFPFLGEHGDLDIATKAAWRIEAHGRSVMCVADSDNLDNVLYQHLAQLFGKPDVLFIGMECEGAPYTWAYGPLLTQPISRQQANGRRLNGSDSVRGMKLINELNPDQVYVYAMGMEPWLNYITSIHYTEESEAIIESNKLIALCREQGRTAERFEGRAEIQLSPNRNLAFKAAAQTVLPVRQWDTEQQASITPPTQLSAPTQTNTGATAVSETDTLSDLLDELHDAGIALAVKDGKLKVNGPKGSLTPALTEKIKQHKPELMKLLRGDSKEPDANTNTNATNTPSQSLDLPQDALLPEHIKPLPKTVPLEEHLLLTGATGFIGAYLLKELLIQTNAIIHCLVRSESVAQAKKRLIETLKSYELWDSAFENRIQPVIGDLALPKFGLNNGQWLELAERTDAIYHNGAQVHHLLPYEQLKPANVGGTLSALELATQHKAKPFHFLSSLSVLPPVEQSVGKHYPENAPLPATPVPGGGYNRSKWMAEQLVHQAIARGLSGSIYRPGPISGDSQTGTFNQNDFLCRLMQGYLFSGKAPQGQLPLDLLPVDYVAKSIVFLSKQSSAEGGCFHLLHPKPVSSDVLFRACINAGYPLERVSYSQWFSELQKIAQSEPNHPLYPLVALFGSRNNSGQDQNPRAHDHQVPYDTSISQTLLQQAPFRLPELNEALFGRYLNAMERNGQLRFAEKQKGATA